MSTSWQVERLRSLAQVNPATRIPRKGQLDFFPMEALVEGGGIARGHSKDVSEAGGYSQFVNGDVLFAKVTPCFENRKCALADGLERGVGLATTEVSVFRPSRRILPEFLLYRLQAFDFQEFGVNAMRGVGGLKRVPDRMVGDFELRLPPLPEQRRIVAFIERELALFAERREAHERKKAVLAEAKQALREAIAFGRLRPGDARSPSEEPWHGEVPSHWGMDRLGNLFREAAELGYADLPVLSVSIHSGISDREMADEPGSRKVSRSEDRGIYKRVEPLDLVYNQMRAWQGGFGVASVEGLVSPAYVVARPRRRVVPAYVEHVLRSPSGIEEMRRRSRGIIDFRLRLYWDEFKDIRIPLPPIEEQSAIAADIDAKLDMVDRQIVLLEKSQEGLALQRSALIHEAVTGALAPAVMGRAAPTKPGAACAV
ncbi:restriction endonuclease subunit S [Burkholderia sp. PAMC 26561]|uniref:restriction endonuclease subunit S n=1 Tax=Burkholderia sp. PAMC 26561 TaxID=1795043 RepID=UPI00076B7410|nr:restriction endonuclease subunit S [Burkholderia sp. PAMC 26561]AME26326.2 hypothetical protein AXG89_20780 [Burkholderia sp. PAMC 26561]